MDASPRRMSDHSQSHASRFTHEGTLDASRRMATQGSTRKEASEGVEIFGFTAGLSTGPRDFLPLVGIAAPSAWFRFLVLPRERRGIRSGHRLSPQPVTRAIHLHRWRKEARAPRGETVSRGLVPRPRVARGAWMVVMAARPWFPIVPGFPGTPGKAGYLPGITRFQ